MVQLTESHCAAIGVAQEDWTPMVRDSARLSFAEWKLAWCPTAPVDAARDAYGASRITWLLVQRTN